MKNFYLFGKLEMADEVVQTVEEIGVNFVEKHQTKGERCVTCATCKFHPFLLDKLYQLGVTYDKLTEVPLGKVYKEVNSLDNGSMLTLWQKPGPLSQTYTREVEKEYAIPFGTMGFFFYTNSVPHDIFYRNYLECEISDFFYFPMWIFPANDVYERYTCFEKSNPGIKMPEKLPTPYNFTTNRVTKVVAPQPHTVCAYSFKVTGLCGEWK